MIEGALMAKEWRSSIRSRRWLAGAWILHREDDQVVCNVPRKVIHHSPAGFEWGYQGSGPADLALNLAVAYLKTPSQGYEKLWKGRCSAVAWACHHDLKRYFLAGMPRPGGRIIRQTVLDWLVDWCRRQQLLC